MTQPHPQERCGHFEVCLTVHSRRLHPGICPFDEKPQNSKTGKCKHDTRTHTPAAPATEPKPLRYSGVTVFTPPELSRHDAATRKAEREQAETTDNILSALKKRYRTEMAIIDYVEMIECEVESLRGGGAP